MGYLLFTLLPRREILGNSLNPANSGLLPLPSFFVTHTLPEMRKAPLPLGCLPVAVRPVAQLRKLPAGLSFENYLKGIFERFSVSLCASPRLACAHFVRHVGYSL